MNNWIDVQMRIFPRISAHHIGVDFKFNQPLRHSSLKWFWVPLTCGMLGIISAPSAYAQTLDDAQTALLTDGCGELGFNGMMGATQMNLAQTSETFAIHLTLVARPLVVLQALRRNQPQFRS